MPRWPSLVLVATVLLGILVCLYLIVTRTLSPSANLSITLFLAVLSMIGSWAASRFYSELSYRRNLRIFALKAAEKVNNLSNELDRLSAFLQQELADTDSTALSEAVLSRDLRIEGAIHIIGTLKSVNDGALSDWQGVIGEELEAQKEEREEREQDLRDLVDQVESLSLRVSGASNERDNATAVLLAKVESDLRMLTAQVSGVPVKRPKPFRQEVSTTCPKCLRPLEYKQKARAGSYKQLNCSSCGSKLFSEFKDGNYVLKINAPVLEGITCPNCGDGFSSELSLIPGQGSATFCPGCGMGLRLVRTKGGVSVKLSAPQPIQSTDVVDEALLERVRAAAPPQPWPQGTQRRIAEELGVATNLVGKAIRELMVRGVFKAQVDGKLFVPEPTESRKATGGGD
jgi:hypothetical protein